MSAIKSGEQLPILSLLEVKEMLFAVTIRATVAHVSEFKI